MGPFHHVTQEIGRYVSSSPVFFPLCYVNADSGVCGGNGGDGRDTDVERGVGGSSGKVEVVDGGGKKGRVDELLQRSRFLGCDASLAHLRGEIPHLLQKVRR